MNILVIGGGHRVIRIAHELVSADHGATRVATAELAYAELHQKTYDGAVIGPEFSPGEIRAMGQEFRIIAGKRKLHIFAFDEAVEGYEAETHPYCQNYINAVIGIFSVRTFTAAYRYVQDRHGI